MKVLQAGFGRKHFTTLYVLVTSLVHRGECFAGPVESMQLVTSTTCSVDCILGFYTQKHFI